MGKVICYDSDGNIMRDLTQWDVGRTIVIKGLGVSESLYAHFWNSSVKDAKVVAMKAVSGGFSAEIPNLLLQHGNPLHIYIYNHEDSTRGKTVFSIIINVNPRAKPDDYFYEEDISYGDISSIVERSVERYLENNPINPGVEFETNDTLSLTDGVLGVNTTESVEADNHMPVTSAGVYAMIGDIEEALAAIYGGAS